EGESEGEGETFELVLNVSPEGAGWIDKNPAPPYLATLPYTVVWLNPIANDGWIFDHWEGTYLNSATVLMDGDKTITAVFVSVGEGEGEGGIEIVPTINWVISRIYESGGSPYSGLDVAMRADPMGRELRTLIKFDLSSISSGTQIESAVLRLYALEQIEYTSSWIMVSRVIENWDPVYTTWTTRINSLEWATPGGSFTGNDHISILSKYGGTGYEDSGSGPYNEWFQLDITSLVQDWVDGTCDNYGLMLWQPNGDFHYQNQEIDFATRDDADVSLRPRLVISVAGTP
ncbi:MAG: DNRLRE domain-containing protein, partial [Candidatus Paceibacterota bacterium]